MSAPNQQGNVPRTNNTLTKKNPFPPPPGPPVTTNANANHPLAFPPPPPPPPAMSVPVQRLSLDANPRESQSSVAPPPPLVSSKVPLPVATGGGVSHSLDLMVDAFLTANTDSSSEVRLRPDILPHDGIERLRELVVRRNWSEVVSLAHDLLHSPNSYSPLYRALLHNPESLSASIESQQQDVVEIMSLYAHGLLRSSRHEDLCRLVDSWSFLHHVGGGAPDWIPASLHILGAASLQYINADDEDPIKTAADALYSVRETLKRPGEFWHLDHALANLFISSKKWRLALVSLEHMRDNAGEVARSEVESLLPPDRRPEATRRLQQAYDCMLLSTQGRVLLQAGTLREAKVVLEKAVSTWDPESPVDVDLKTHSAIQHVNAQRAANQGLWCFADEKYADALEFFRQSSCLVNMEIPYSRTDWVSFSLVSQHTRFDLYGQVLNNVACCALYTCRLAEAIAVLENVIRRSPAFMTERVASNLCTLYELAADTPVATRQKQTLQALAQRFSLGPIDRSCFRLG